MCNLTKNADTRVFSVIESDSATSDAIPKKCWHARSYVFPRKTLESISTFGPTTGKILFDKLDNHAELSIHLYRNTRLYNLQTRKNSVYPVISHNEWSAGLFIDMR